MMKRIRFYISKLLVKLSWFVSPNRDESFKALQDQYTYGFSYTRIDPRNVFNIPESKATTKEYFSGIVTSDEIHQEPTDNIQETTKTDTTKPKG